jgi:hypothetical protein
MDTGAIWSLLPNPLAYTFLLQVKLILDTFLWVGKGETYLLDSVHSLGVPLGLGTGVRSGGTSSHIFIAPCCVLDNIVKYTISTNARKQV